MAQTRLPIIWAFGNSTVSIFSGKEQIVPIWPKRSVDILPYFRTVRLGPVTAFQAMKHTYDILEIVRYGNTGFDKFEDTILMVFGEIDVRAHIVAQAQKQARPIKHIAQIVAKRYSEAIIELKNRGFKLAVFGCIAGFVLDKKKPLPWPHFGTLEQRNRAAKWLNEMTGTMCKDRGIPFISVFDDMIDINGVTKTQYLDGDGTGCHLGSRILPLILWKFRDKGLIPWGDALLPYESGIYRIGGGEG